MALPVCRVAGGHGGMRFVEFTTEAELEALRPAWNALLLESSSATIFLTWEWVWAWWCTYGKPGELRILAAYNESGRLRGLAPLRRQDASRYGQTVQVLSFIGD